MPKEPWAKKQVRRARTELQADWEEGERVAVSACSNGGPSISIANGCPRHSASQRREKYLWQFDETGFSFNAVLRLPAKPWRALVLAGELGEVVRNEVDPLPKIDQNVKPDFEVAVQRVASRTA